MKNYIIFALTIVLTGFIGFGFSSCDKKIDTTAKIMVRDTSNSYVSGARVILYGTSTTIPQQAVERRDTAYTNSSGIAIFNYNDIYQTGQAGVAVLDIIASKGDQEGEGIIKIEEEESNVATVFIQP